MKLADWLTKHPKKLTQDAFGKKVGVTQGRVSQIAKYGTRDVLMIRRIEEATGYAVTEADLLPSAQFIGEPAGDAA